MHHFRDTTRAVRVGQHMDLGDAHGEPIALNSAYVFRSAAEAAGRFSGAVPGNVYSRFTNPTVHAFEQRIAALEGGESAVAFASGMAAIAGIAQAWLASGCNVVCSRDVFGTTLHAFRQYFGRFGVEVRVVDLARIDEWQAAIDARTRLAFVESPSNPLQQLADIPAVARLAHAAGALLVVDNTLLTPVFQRPLSLGADLVLHSAGKFLDGQGRCMGGVVIGRAELTHALRGVLRMLGASLSPMNAWLLLKSLETLELRVQRQSESAQFIAEWLESRPAVRRVFHAGLASHPQRALAKVQQAGHGAIVAFEVGRERADAWRFIDALSLVSIATHLGDTRSMATHPATTTHGRLSEAEREAAGIGDTLVRLSIGLEHPDDLMRDIDRALSAASRRPGRRGALPEREARRPAALPAGARP